MRKTPMRRLIVLLLSSIALHSLSWGQSYPSQPIRLVVGYPAGGASDVIARVIGQELNTSLQQPVIIDNRAGAGGTIGAANVAKAPKDGYSLFLGDTGSLILSKAIYKTLPLDPDADLTPIALVAQHPFVLAINSAVPVKTIQEFIAYAKDRPGALSYASPGTGSPHHIAMERFNLKVGINIVHVPYRGAAPATTDFVGGQIPVMLMDPASAIANIKTGKIHVIVVLAPSRIPQFPDIPTNAEAGIPGVEASNIWALMAPSGTPSPIVDKLAGSLKAAIELPATRQRLFDMGITTSWSSSAQLTELLKQQREAQRALVRKLDIKAD